MAARTRKKAASTSASSSVAPGPPAQDLLERVVSLRDQVAVYSRTPRRSRNDRILYDAWWIVFRPRAGNMRRRLDRLARSTNWEFDDQGRARGLRPVRIRVTVRDMATLYVELDGCHRQLERLRIVFRPHLVFGTLRRPHVGVGSSSQIAAQEKALDKALREARKARIERAEQILKEAQKALGELRSGLTAQSRTLQAIVHDIQRAEEERLRGRAAFLASDITDRRRADDLLDRLREGRLDAVHFSEGTSSKYGTLLRQSWLGPWSRLVRLLDAPRS